MFYCHHSEHEPHETLRGAVDCVVETALQHRLIISLPLFINRPQNDEERASGRFEVDEQVHAEAEVQVEAHRLLMELTRTRFARIHITGPGRGRPTDWLVPPGKGVTHSYAGAPAATNGVDFDLRSSGSTVRVG